MADDNAGDPLLQFTRDNVALPVRAYDGGRRPTPRPTFMSWTALSGGARRMGLCRPTVGTSGGGAAGLRSQPV